jgi:prepilin-type N-terminal cleavage/methylation domain-containing protein
MYEQSVKPPVLNRCGYTLAELAVVVFIIGLLSAIIFPRISNIGELKLKNAARKLARTITYLHSQASASRHVLRLALNMKTGEYTLDYLNPKGKFEEITFPLFSSGKLPREIKVEQFITLFNGPASGTTARLYFLPEGFCEQALITLSDRSERMISLLVHPITGRVKVQKGESQWRTLKVRA